MNDPAQLLSLFLNGALGRSGRKRASKAARFVSGNKGFLTASGLMAAAGVAWGLYDSLQAQAQPHASGAPAGAGAPVSGVPPVPSIPAALVTSPVPADVLRIVRLTVSAARADGTLAPQERTLILEHARNAGVAGEVEIEIDRPHLLSDIVRGVSDETSRHDLYILAFSIVRADESVTGAERVYLAQLAHHLGIDAATAARLEAETARRIDTIDTPAPAP